MDALLPPLMRAEVQVFGGSAKNFCAVYDLFSMTFQSTTSSQPMAEEPLRKPK